MFYGYLSFKSFRGLFWFYIVLVIGSWLFLVARCFGCWLVSSWFYVTNFVREATFKGGRGERGNNYTLFLFKAVVFKLPLPSLLDYISQAGPKGEALLLIPPVGS